MKRTWMLGYEMRPIWSLWIDGEDQIARVPQTDAGIIEAYMLARQSIHWQPGTYIGKANASCLSVIVNVLKPILHEKLENAGWESHIMDHLRTSKNDTYIHDALTHLAVHQVPFSSEWNIKLPIDVLCNEDGELRTKAEALDILCERIGEPMLALREMVEESAISMREAEIISAIMQDMGLMRLHDVWEDGDEHGEFRSGPIRIEWVVGEERAEEMAREYLEDGDYRDIWKDAITNDIFDGSFSDWIDHVLDVDGWAHVLCPWDGQAHWLDVDDDEIVYWRT